MNKKTIRNILVLTLAAVVLVTASVFTTMAYLLSSAKVSNVFTIGQVEIEMFESPVDKDGKIVDGFTGKKNADTNSYQIFPGNTYDKDPSVYIKAGSADTLLFVKARNQIANIEIPEDDALGRKTMKAQMEEKGWRRVAQTSIGDWIYIYAGTNATSTNADKVATIISSKNEEQRFDLFEEFTIDPNCDLEKYKLAQGAAVTLTAFAIQGGTFNDDSGNISAQNIVDAWNAIVGKVEYERGNEITLNQVMDQVNAAATN